MSLGFEEGVCKNAKPATDVDAVRLPSQLQCSDTQGNILLLLFCLLLGLAFCISVVPVGAYSR